MEFAKRIRMVEDDPKNIEPTLTNLSQHNLANVAAITRNGVKALDDLYCRKSSAR